MAVKLPDPGNGIPEQKTGNDEWTNMKIVRDNFADQSNAASRLVGTASGQIVENTGVGIQDTGLGANTAVWMSNEQYNDPTKAPPNGFYWVSEGVQTPYATILQMGYGQLGWRSNLIISIDKKDRTQAFISASPTQESTAYVRTELYTTLNTTKDSNGFLKAASPIVDLYDDRIELNRIAGQQGEITFEKLGTGNYLVKGSLGFAQEGWYIEMPKDANGNVLVAVVYEQLKNNDISVKTYAKRFDDETGDVVANLAKPRDIPEGRCINLRLHEVKEEKDEPAI